MPIVQIARAGARSRAYAGTLASACKRANYRAACSANPDSLHSFPVSLSFVRVICCFCSRHRGDGTE